MTTPPADERARLQRRLRSKRKSLLADLDRERLETISQHVREKWRNARPIIFFTPHDDTHCERVEERLYELLGDEEKIRSKLRDTEVFLVLASVWLHDIGMIPELFKDDPKPTMSDEISEWDTRVREEHGPRSARYVETKGTTDLGLTDIEIRHIAEMCRLHRRRAYGDLFNEPWETDGFRVQLLTAYLRLADALHIPYKGGARDYKIYKALGMDPVSRFHWLKSKYADSILVSPDDFKITIRLRKPDDPSSPIDWEARMTPLKELLQTEVQDELDCVKDILARGSLSVFLTVEADTVMSATDADRGMSPDDVRELEQLLSNIQLFHSRLTPNASEVADTILRQIRVFLATDTAQESIQYLREYREKVLSKILEDRPCHVLAGKIDEMLKAPLQDGGMSDEQRVNTITAEADRWSAERERVLSEIADKPYGILSDGAAILLYGYSEAVLRCLGHLSPDRKQSTVVYVCEARTKTEYRHNNRLIYCDAIRYAEALWNIGMRSIHYVSDAGASNLFSRRKVAKVLFGANGVSLAGRVGHTLGHLAIADMAKTYDIPVFVIADSMKIGHLKEDPGLERANQWLTTDASFEADLKRFRSCNPREDVIPPDRIKGIITEKGQLSATDIARHR